MITREQAAHSVAYGDVNLLKMTEVMKLTTMSRSTLTRWIDEGSFPQPMFVFGPHLQRWHPEQVKEWVRQQVHAQKVRNLIR